MPYDVVIKTTKGDIQTQIDDLKELEALLIQYYETYISVNAKEVKTLKKEV